MNRLVAEIVIALVVYTFGFHVGHHCGFMQRDSHLNEETPALRQQPEARSTLLEKGSTMVRVKQSSHGVESGSTFGNWVALGPPFSTGVPHQFRIVCRCACGMVSALTTNGLRTRASQCQSCRPRLANLVHGNGRRECRTRLYRIWQNMRARCTNPKSDNWHLYGGKGVVICDEWQSFVGFQSWALSNGYEDHLEIDRENSSGNYEPGNCRWVTEKKQAQNTSRNIPLTAFGETKTMAEWSEDDRCAVSYETLRCRVRKYLWGHQQAIETPVQCVA